MLKRKIAIAGVLILLLIGAAGTLSACTPKSIDDIWNARLYTEEDGSQAVRIYGLTKKGARETKLTLPETIDGYPVKKLQATNDWSTKLWSNREVGYASLGDLQYLIIEPSVTIGEGFFEKSKVRLLEFTNSKPSVRLGALSSTIDGYVLIPESYSYSEYFGTSGGQGGYHRSDIIINEYVIVDGFFRGYIGEERVLEVPENVQEIWDILYMPLFDSIKFPETLVKIEHKDGLRNYKNITVTVSNKTIIENGALDPSVNIIRY